jgi:hypothetical protein
LLWTNQNAGTFEALLSVSALDGVTALASGIGGTILRTANGGASWDRQVSANSSNLFGMYALDPVNVWVAGSNASILKNSPPGPLFSSVIVPNSIIQRAANFPNPFNPATTISFTISKTAVLSMTVFNVLGQEVIRLFENQLFEAGEHTVRFTALGSRGTDLPSGIYFYRILVNGGSDQRVNKMLFLK